jgi:LysR family transcriptional regulator, transcription activator of glutamate synthase operon
VQLEWFYAFMETCKYKSLTKASERLNITQPALSKLIRSLERDVGVMLFHRTATGVELTTAGVHLQERIKPILDEIHVLIDDLRSMDEHSQLKIGVLPSIASYFLPDKMSFINESFPGTQLVVASTTDEVIQKLLTGDVQLAIAESRRSPVRHFWQSILLEESYFCIVQENSRFSSNQSISVSELLNEPLVVYPSNCDIRSVIVRNFLERGVEPTISLEIPFSESILAFVGAGTGITIVPRMIADQAHHYGLKSVRLIDFDGVRRVSVIARSEKLGKSVLRVLKKAYRAPRSSESPLKKF